MRRTTLSPLGYWEKPDPLAELGRDDDGFKITEEDDDVAAWGCWGLDWRRGDERS